MSIAITDSSGRQFKKLRLNLLDACNMRCMYCMPENQVFKNISDLLSTDQITNMVNNLNKHGINQVRLTGGEPLLHPNFKGIINSLSSLKLDRLALTTNAILLENNLNFLQEHNLTHINVSLDSLLPNSFEFITKTSKFEIVMSAILKAKKMGFKLKINTVMLKNINFEEIEKFIEFSAKHDIEVRFLELMKIGQALGYYERHFVSAEDAISRIQENWKLSKISMPADSTSFNYFIEKDDQVANIGFIASESKSFCGDCSRLRLSNQGTLRPCIMINEGPNIKDLASKNYELTLQGLINKKPLTRLDSNQSKMNEIGG